MTNQLPRHTMPLKTTKTELNIKKKPENHQQTGKKTILRKNLVKVVKLNES